MTLSSSYDFTKINGGIVEFLQSLLLKAAMVYHYGHPENHPIIVINSLKNILGDVRDNPSRTLMVFGNNYINEKSMRKYDENILKNIRNKGVTSSVFIMDLEDAIFQSNSKQAEKEAAKLFLLSDSPQAILESLVKISLLDFNRYGIFSYHLLRAFAFGKVTKKDSWIYIQCLLRQIKSVNFTRPRQDVTMDIENCFQNVLKERSRTLTNQFNSAYRLYHSNYVRTGHFQNSICNWISSKEWKIKNRKIKHSPSEELISFRNSGGNYFVKIAESLINRTENVFTKGRKIVFLDSLRMICKDVPEKTLRLIEQRLKNI